MKRIYFACLLALLTISVIGQSPELYSATKKDSAQKKSKYKFLSIKYQAGTVLQTNAFLEGDNKAGKPIDYYQSLALQYGRQTDGSKEWEHVFNFPFFGVGFYTANFFNIDELGHPMALYGFLGLPVKRWQRSSLGYKLGFGLTYNWEPYDTYENPFNVAIGSYRTVYIDASIYYQYQLGKRWDLNAGFGFTHFSNGGTKKPNSGINLVSPFVELKYNLKDRPLLVRKIVDPYKQHHELSFNLGLSGRQIVYDVNENEGLDDKYQDVTYTVVNISAAYLKQTTWKNKFGGGIDLTYDESIDAQIDINDGKIEKVPAVSFGEKMSMGVFGTYEFCVDQLSVASYLGAYVFRKKIDDPDPILYQKFGVKYHFKSDLYAGVLVRAHNFSVADFIEWHVGYRIKWD